MAGETYAAALAVEGTGRVLDGLSDDLLDLLVRDRGLGGEGVDGAAALDGLEEGGRAGHGGAVLGGGEARGEELVCVCGRGEAAVGEGEQGPRAAIIYGGNGGQGAHHFGGRRRYLWEIWAGELRRKCGSNHLTDAAEVIANMYLCQAVVAESSARHCERFVRQACSLRIAHGVNR